MGRDEGRNKKDLSTAGRPQVLNRRCEQNAVSHRKLHWEIPSPQDSEQHFEKHQRGGSPEQVRAIPQVRGLGIWKAAVCNWEGFRISEFEQEGYLSSSPHLIRFGGRQWADR